MDYLLDTNILILYGRQDDKSRRLEEAYGLFSGQHRLLTSVVTLGELNSLFEQRGYGEYRQSSIKKILTGIAILDINLAEIIEAYGKIDAFSQNRPKRPLVDHSSRNMGKNDLWIAATAHVFDLRLITTDRDYDHLHNKFIQLEYVDQLKFQ